VHPLPHPTLSLVQIAGLALAGVAAGLVGSAGGITSLISYPALLAAGLPALSANVANNVALVACLPGSALGSKPELCGRGRWLAAWAPLAAAGGGAGAALLLSTPAGLFRHVVPFLVAGAAAALALEPRLRRWRRGRRRAHNRLGLFGGLLSLSVYNGYFGAGAGVMILTLLLVLVQPHLPTANALKNVLIGVASSVAAAIFVLTGPVRWAAILPLAAGMLVGSRLGPPAARRLPRGVLRWLAAMIGAALAVELWLHAGG